MSAALILSIFLIWLMVCAICMAWFTGAKRSSGPHHSAVSDQPWGTYLWAGLFTASLIAWICMRFAMAH